MTTFTETWDATYETLPPDTGESVSQGASRIRSLKKAVQERLEVDHSHAGDTHDGKHLKVTLKFRAAKPTNDATDGALYTKEISTVTELFYVDDTGAEVQLTSGGLISSFPSGTKMLFQQTAAPTGWTKDTTHNNKAFRVVSGSAGSGGNTAFTSVFGSSKTAGSTAPGTDSQGAHTHTAQSAGAHTHPTDSQGGHSHTITIATHAISIAEMAAHTHSLPANDDSTGGIGFVQSSDGGGAVRAASTGSIGSGTAHGHAGSSSNSTGAHTHTATSAGAHTHSTDSQGAHTHTVDSHTHTLSLDLQFVDIIIATKD